MARKSDEVSTKKTDSGHAREVHFGNHGEFFTLYDLCQIPTTENGMKVPDNQPHGCYCCFKLGHSATSCKHRGAPNDNLAYENKNGCLGFYPPQDPACIQGMSIVDAWPTMAEVHPRGGKLPAHMATHAVRAAIGYGFITIDQVEALRCSFYEDLEDDGQWTLKPGATTEQMVEVFDTFLRLA